MSSKTSENTTYAVPVTPPSEAETANIFFALLKLNHISCATCNSFKTEYKPYQGDGACEVIDGMSNSFLEEASGIPADFLCNNWEKQ